MQFRSAKVSCSFGGERKEFSCTDSGENEALSYRLSADPDRFRFAIAPKKEITLHRVSAEFSFAFQPDDRLFLNGYQSWTDSREHTTSDRLRGIDHLPRFVVKAYDFNRYGDYDFVSYGKRRGELHGFSYAYVRRGDRYLLFASLAEESGFTVLRFDVKRQCVTLEKDCAGRAVSTEYPVFDLVLIEGAEEEVFDRWFALLGTPKPRGKRIVGYTSWYNLYENISEKSIESDLAGFAASPEKPDVFQIDDGYESAVGDWLDVDPVKFPHGMGAAAEKIRSAGMMPGLWLAPFAAQKKSKLALEHPDWLLHDENGAAVTGGSNWQGFYALDLYHPGVRAYLAEVFDTVLNRWGYGLVKLDFLYAACIVPRRDKTRAEVMFDGMRFLRELCGDAWILGCGVPLVPAFGLVDYCRIGCDVSLSWDDAFYMHPMHRERPSTRNTIQNTIFRRALDGRAFRNDPDVFLLRENNIRLTSAQKEMLAVVNALFGGVLFTSDNVGEYSPEAKLLPERESILCRLAFGMSARTIFIAAIPVMC